MFGRREEKVFKERKPFSFSTNKHISTKKRVRKELIGFFLRLSSHHCRGREKRRGGWGEKVYHHILKKNYTSKNDEKTLPGYEEIIPSIIDLLLLLAELDSQICCAGVIPYLSLRLRFDPFSSRTPTTSTLPL